MARSARTSTRACLDTRAATLRAQIVDPGATASGDAFATMPGDFGERMSDAELDELVAFLLQTARR